MGAVVLCARPEGQDPVQHVYGGIVLLLIQLGTIGYEKNVVQVHKRFNALGLEGAGYEPRHRLYGVRTHACTEWNAAIKKIIPFKCDS